MTITTLASYLLGNRRAIEEIAANRWSLLVGFILVLTGGLARNYDGAYLPAEWQVLLHGPLVSSVNALVLFTLMYLVAVVKQGRAPNYGTGLLSFLGLFWMTAPMAWLYAIPYERFLSPVDAIRANLWTFALISVWRVLLMARVLSVLYNAARVPVLLIVLAFADAVLIGAVVTMKAPVVDFMGGLQHSPEDALLAGVRFAVGFWSIVAAPLLFIAALIGLKWLRPAWTLRSREPLRAPHVLLGFAAACLLAWIPALRITQAEQRLRYEAETLLRNGKVAVALASMSEHQRSEYPPIWDPPPRMGYFDQTPSLNEVRAALASEQHAGWVNELYLDKSWREFTREFVWESHRTGADRAEGIQTLQARRDEFVHSESPAQEKRAILLFHSEHDSRLTGVQREAIRTLLKETDEKRARLLEQEPAQSAKPEP